jgi:hypothetical protein
MKRSITVGLLILLISCESSENKLSRLTIDKYARKLSSMVENIEQSRSEEGSQTRLSLNGFYQRYTSQVETYINDLNFETVTSRYSLFRDDLLSFAKGLNFYLNCRKSAINNLSDAFSSFESTVQSADNIKEYVAEARSSYYSSDMYIRLARQELNDLTENSIDFIVQRIDYQEDIHKMDSIFVFLDSTSMVFNERKGQSRLMDSLNLPTSFCDTINDWVYSSRRSIMALELPEPDLD